MDYGGIWTLIPEDCDSRVDPWSASREGSEQFLRDGWRAYVNSLMVELSPGIVLGSIAALGSLVFLLWICFRLRRRKIIARARRVKRQELQDQRAAAKAQAQFIASGDDGGGAAAPAAPKPGWRQRLTAGRVLKWATVLFGLAVIGVSGWGLAESITATDSLVSNFWMLVDSVQQLVDDLEASLSSLAGSLSDVATTLGNVQSTAQDIVDTVQGVPLLGPLIGKVLPMDTIEGFVGDTAKEAVASMADAADLLTNTVLPVFNETVQPALDSVYQQQGWSLKLEDKWRYIVAAVIFGLLILLAATTSATCWTMRHGVAATASVSALWLLVCAAMFLGLGLFNGAKSVANDACLYSEDLVVNLLNETVQGDAQSKVQSALAYYLGKEDLMDSSGNQLLVNSTTECDPELTAALLRQLAEIELHSALVFAWKVADELPRISDLLGGLSLPTIPLVNVDLDGIKDSLLTATDQLQDLLDDVCNTTLLLVRENRIWPLYVDTKAYICCDLTAAIYDVWVPWVVAGVLSLCLALLASIRVITSTVAPTGRMAVGTKDVLEADPAGAEPAGAAAMEGNVIQQLELSKQAAAGS